MASPNGNDNNSIHSDPTMSPSMTFPTLAPLRVGTFELARSPSMYADPGTPYLTETDDEEPPTPAPPEQQVEPSTPDRPTVLTSTDAPAPKRQRFEYPEQDEPLTPPRPTVLTGTAAPARRLIEVEPSTPNRPTFLAGVDAPERPVEAQRTARVVIRMLHMLFPEEFKALRWED
jgi:hypothetical protein